MAEPSVSTDSPTVWDGLLDTKLHRPRLQRGFVPRRRLVDRLDGRCPAASRWCARRPAGARPPCWATGPAEPRQVGWVSWTSPTATPPDSGVRRRAWTERPGTAERFAPLLGPDRSAKASGRRWSTARHQSPAAARPGRLPRRRSPRVHDRWRSWSTTCRRTCTWWWPPDRAAAPAGPAPGPRRAHRAARRRPALHPGEAAALPQRRLGLDAAPTTSGLTAADRGLGAGAATGRRCRCAAARPGAFIAGVRRQHSTSVEYLAGGARPPARRSCGACC